MNERTDESNKLYPYAYQSPCVIPYTPVPQTPAFLGKPEESNKDNITERACEIISSSSDSFEEFKKYIEYNNNQFCIDYSRRIFEGTPKEMTLFAYIVSNDIGYAEKLFSSEKTPCFSKLEKAEYLYLLKYISEEFTHFDILLGDLEKAAGDFKYIAVLAQHLSKCIGKITKEHPDNIQLKSILNSLVRESLDLLPENVNLGEKFSFAAGDSSKKSIFAYVLNEENEQFLSSLIVRFGLKDVDLNEVSSNSCKETAMWYLAYREEDEAIPISGYLKDYRGKINLNVIFPERHPATPAWLLVQNGQVETLKAIIKYNLSDAPVNLDASDLETLDGEITGGRTLAWLLAFNKEYALLREIINQYLPEAKLNIDLKARLRDKQDQYYDITLGYLLILDRQYDLLEEIIRRNASIGNLLDPQETHNGWSIVDILLYRKDYQILLNIFKTVEFASVIKIIQTELSNFREFLEYIHKEDKNYFEMLSKYADNDILAYMQELVRKEALGAGSGSKRQPNRSASAPNREKRAKRENDPTNLTLPVSDFGGEDNDNIDDSEEEEIDRIRKTTTKACDFASNDSFGKLKEFINTADNKYYIDFSVKFLDYDTFTEQNTLFVYLISKDINYAKRLFSNEGVLCFSKLDEAEYFFLFEYINEELENNHIYLKDLEKTSGGFRNILLSKDVVTNFILSTGKEKEHRFDVKLMLILEKLVVEEQSVLYKNLDFNEKAYFYQDDENKRSLFYFLFKGKEEGKQFLYDLMKTYTGKKINLDEKIDENKTMFMQILKSNLYGIREENIVPFIKQILKFSHGKVDLTKKYLYEEGKFLCRELDGHGCLKYAIEQGVEVIDFGAPKVDYNNLSFELFYLVHNKNYDLVQNFVTRYAENLELNVNFTPSSLNINYLGDEANTTAWDLIFNQQYELFEEIMKRVSPANRVICWDAGPSNLADENYGVTLEWLFIFYKEYRRLGTLINQYDVVNFELTGKPKFLEKYHPLLGSTYPFTLGEILLYKKEFEVLYIIVKKMGVSKALELINFVSKNNSSTEESKRLKENLSIFLEYIRKEDNDYFFDLYSESGEEKKNAVWEINFCMIEFMFKYLTTNFLSCGPIVEPDDMSEEQRHEKACAENYIQQVLSFSVFTENDFVDKHQYRALMEKIGVFLLQGVIPIVGKYEEMISPVLKYLEKNCEVRGSGLPMSDTDKIRFYAGYFMQKAENHAENLEILAFSYYQKYQVEMKLQEFRNKIEDDEKKMKEYEEQIKRLSSADNAASQPGNSQPPYQYGAPQGLFGSYPPVPTTPTTLTPASSVDRRKEESTNLIPDFQSLLTSPYERAKV